MVTLVCALVGEAGRAFCVEIDEDDWVATLKNVIKAKRQQTITCPARKLQLYLAKKDGAWLDSDGADAVTLDSHGNLQGFEKMDPLLWIKNDRYFGEHFQLNEGEIHVLVVMPRDEIEATQRWMAANFHRVAGTPPPTETIAFVPLPTVHSVDYVSLPTALLVKCGLFAPQTDTVLMYCRRQVRELWDYIQEQTIEDDASVTIVGPSGTGKSFSALCFVTQLDPSEWNVVWIHFGPWCTSCLSMGTREYWKDIDESTFVVPRVAGKRLFVCLDGYTKTPVHKTFLQKLICGMTKEERFLVSSSMATIGKLNAQDAEREKLRVFSMHSWTLDEYEEACADATFYEHVVDKLDATTVSGMHDEGDAMRDVETKKHALARKLYYAGGSCRWMFQRTTEQVKQRLQMAMANVPHNTDLICYCCGAYHHDTMHLLYGMTSDRGISSLFPVSSYAVSLFAEASHTETIEHLAGRVRRLENPVVNGYFLEWLVLALVPKRRVKLIGDGDVVDELPSAFVFQFDPKKRFREPLRLITGGQRWLQPVVQNHGGYDAVYFDTDQGNVIFIQVARSSTHHFKMRFFIEVLHQLQAAKMKIERVEIYFVVKSALDLSAFPIGEMEGRDELGQFDARWKRPEETNVKVRALEMVARF